MVENIDIEETTFMQTPQVLSITNIVYDCHIFSQKAPKTKASWHNCGLE